MAALQKQKLDPVAPPTVTAGRQHSQLWDMWRRFRTNKTALIGGVILLVLIILAVTATWVSPYDPFKQDYNSLLQGSSLKHWMGTDDLGRDIFSRIIYGARVSMGATTVSVGLALVVGLPVGMMSGYYRGFWDEIVIMRIVDAMQAFPSLILALAIAAVLGPGLTNAMIAIGIGFIPGLVRIVRAQTMQVRESEYVTAAISLGAGDARVLFKHILPNILGPILVEASLALAAGIIAEAGLSYLGLGAQPPIPSWGSALKYAQGYLTTAPWMSYWPGIAIFLAVLSFNLVGDGLRDALDPRTRK